MKNEDIKILIIGSTPYSNSSQARALSTYLNKWKNKSFCIKQIYTRPVEPSFELCDEFYQITDKMILKNLLSRKQKGRFIHKSDFKCSSIENNSPDISKGHFFNVFKNHKNNFVRLLRSALWGNRWKDQELFSWAKTFNPDLIFLCFGDDLHLFRISSFLSNYLQIPIVTVISDDYYFLTRKSLLPFSAIYHAKYGKALRRLFDNKYGFGVAFNSQRICIAYLSHFDIKLYEVVPVSCSKEFSSLSKINSNNKTISYFGNFECGRYHSIIDFAKLLNDNYSLKICGPANKAVAKKFSKIKNINYYGNLEYADVVSLASDSTFVLIAESFKKSDSKKVKFSLSTKISDCLVSGRQIITIGHKDSGVIDYFKDKNCSLVCENKKDLVDLIGKIKFDEDMVKKAKQLALEERDINKNGELFYGLCLNVLKGKRG